MFAQKNKIFLGLLLLVMLVLSSSCVTFTASSDSVYVIPVEGEIDPGLANLVNRGIEEAEQAGAEHIVFEINSFGGLVESSVEIKDAIINTGIETTTFVSGRAFSGAALVALAGDNLILKPGTSIGAAETIPVTEKNISAVRSEFRSTAESQGRDGELAAAMVDADLEIDGIIESGKILSLTALEAEEFGISDQLADNLEQAISVAVSENYRVENIQPAAYERLARWITSPVVSALLLILGLLGLVLEFIVPGWGVGGTSGVLCLGLFYTGHMIHGYASWGLVFLLLVGFFLLGLEIFVVPGFGVTGIGGIAAILGSIYFVFPTAEMGLPIISIVLVTTIVGTIILLKIFGSSRLWKRIAMDYSETVDKGYTASRGTSELMGKTGKAATPLRPAGIAEISGKRVDVVSEGGMIARGTMIEVIDVQGRRVVVKKADDEAEGE